MILAYHIAPLTAVTDQDIADINRLLAQLSEKYTPHTGETIGQTIVKSQVFVARGSKGGIIGMLVLAPVHKITTTPVGMVHDVVVDEAYRSKGMGRALMDAAVAESRRMGLHYLEFTSSPKRVEANRLYQKMGFRPRETNVYRIEL